MKAPRPIFTLAFLLVLCFSLAASLHPVFAIMAGDHAGDSMIKTVLGDGRKMFANHFYTQADVYFHSGFYPNFIEQSYATGGPKKIHIAERQEDGKMDDDDEKEEPGMNFMGKSADWIEGFGRHFRSHVHTHLDKPGAAREILPWLQLSAELDPQKVETYTVASFWLRKNMHKPDEAEAFLRQGLKANPTSFEILYELGLIYYEDRKEPERALNLLDLALVRWRQAEVAHRKPDPHQCDAILAHLSTIAEANGNWSNAVSYLEQEMEFTPSKEAVGKRIQELRGKIPH